MTRNLGKMLSACCLSMALLGIVGCGGGDSSSSQETAETAKQEVVPPTSSIPNPAEEATEEPQKDVSAEYYLEEIRKVRMRPFASGDDLDKLRSVRKQRNLEILDYAQKAIGLTYENPEHVDEFTASVAAFMEARLQLALTGEKELIDAMYDDAASIIERDPKSEAAAEAGYALARFAHTNARTYGAQDPRWMKEFANQARLFASHFPAQESRAVPLLFAAAWTCEAQNMLDEAKVCYQLLAETFPESGQAPQATASLRRLNLPGTKLELAGPTIDGGFISVDDFQDKVRLVVFWASDNSQCDQIAPEIQALVKKYPDDIRIIGVNLDVAEPDVDRFLEKHQLSWRQIFFSEPNKRRWENPIVKYFGIRNIPMIWVVDREGKVISQNVSIQELPALVQSAVERKIQVSQSP